MKHERVEEYDVKRVDEKVLEDVKVLEDEKVEEVNGKDEWRSAYHLLLSFLLPPSFL